MIRGARRLAVEFFRREPGRRKFSSSPPIPHARGSGSNISGFAIDRELLSWRNLAPIRGIPRAFCSGSVEGRRKEEGEQGSIDAAKILLGPEKIPEELVEASLAQEPEPEPEPELSPAEAREVSDAEEFKVRFEAMLLMKSKFQRSIAAMGALQLFGGWWIVGTHYQAETLYFFLTGLSATLSFQMAYLLHSAIKPPAKLPDNKALTLPIFSIKSMTNFLARTHIIVCISATGLAGAFAYEVVPMLVR